MKVAALQKLRRLSSQGVALAVLLLLTAPLENEDVPPPAEDIGALLLIIGCSDDFSTCSELPASLSIFETKEDCDQQLPDSLGAFTGVDDPYEPPPQPEVTVRTREEAVEESVRKVLEKLTALGHLKAT